MFGRKKTKADVVYDDDGSLVTVATAFDVAAGDAAAVALLPDGPVLVRQVFTGVGVGDLDELASMAAEEGWGALTHEADGRAVVRSTRALTPLAAAQQRARMTGIAHRLAVSYEGWEAAVPRGR